MRKINLFVKRLSIAGFVLFLMGSFMYDFQPGKEMGRNFFSFSGDMLKIFPCVLILIGLFEVWVKKETIKKHLGDESGFRGYLWAVLLAGTTVGGLYIAFPTAYSLYRNGARLGVIFSYIGAAGICRIPMTIFEASFMGIKFTLIRFLVSLPLVIISSAWLERYLKNIKYEIKNSQIM